ncbi:aminopeptidase N [Gynuella sp.]|uniref:aminopeptidase N n=1 Tax=Gynuella sp. TaxID=2969146 RepID=UPI003D127644
MSQTEPQTIYLKDYQVPDHLVDEIFMNVNIEQSFTIVEASLKIRRNPESDNDNAPLCLYGADLETLKIAIDGRELSAAEYHIEEEKLLISDLPDSFEILTQVKIYPDRNTSLEGFYLSGSMLCTQCEAEGFRKITWYPDRPDVMAVFTTRLEADKKQFPVLLANGNPTEKGDLDNGRHFATWHDPFKKPSYLFAMVAGDLVKSESQFTTCSGRVIDIHVFVEQHNAAKTDFAHGALHRSMRWDEERFGREYDLDLFMIVASDFFNMGAMENKGLNIFNSSAVLANEKTTTDEAFERIESIIGHEYFHNWSGNRVTCRDWFQLSLKEGFTVFRDAEFTADLHSRAVKRVDDVTVLKTLQFAQDAGAMAHPVRPGSYIEINNFYTLTVYEKGAEVVRMIHTLLGAELFRKGSDHYFEHNDGKAATIEDFIASMHAVSGFDFTQFMLWYEQAGTPVVEVSSQYDEVSRTYALTFKQTVPDTHGQTGKKPMLIPVKLGLLDGQGNDIALDIEPSEQFNPVTSVLSVTQAEQTFVCKQIPVRPVPSLLRDFSAPVELKYAYSRQELAFLMANDSNEFNRWDAAQRLMVDVLIEQINGFEEVAKVSVADELLAAVAAVLSDQTMDLAIKARMLVLPAEQYLFELMNPADVDIIHQVREAVANAIALRYQAEFRNLYQQLNQSKPYAFNFQDASERSLKNIALSYWIRSADPAAMAAVETQYRESNNFTDRSRALGLIVNYAAVEVRQQYLDEFLEQWKHDSLMVQYWFGLQAGSEKTDLAAIQTLENNNYFDIKNPNIVRHLIGVFANRNLVQFHKTDGSGYSYLADKIIQLNKSNPQIASRLCSVFQGLPRHTPERQKLMRVELNRIKDEPKLSADVFEIIDRILS